MKKLLLLCVLSLLLACFYASCDKPDEPQVPEQEQPGNNENTGDEDNGGNGDGENTGGDDNNGENGDTGNGNENTGGDNGDNGDGENTGDDDNNGENDDSENDDEEPGEVPSVMLLPKTSVLEIPMEGGSFLFEYQIKNPVSGGKVSVALAESYNWVSNLKSIDPNSTSGTISFNVSKNEGTGDREAVFVVTYAYGEDKASAEMKIAQLVKSFDYDFTAKAAICRSFEDANGYVYDITLGDVDYSTHAPGADYYELSFCGEKHNGDMLPPDGVYTVVPRNPNKGNIDAEYSGFQRVKEDDVTKEIAVDFTSGEVWVMREGNEFIISGYVVDKSTYRHKVYYKGNPDVMEHGPQSTLFEDMEKELVGMEASIKYESVEDRENPSKGYNIWLISLFTKEKAFGDPCLQVQLTTPIDVNISTGLKAGVFKMASKAGMSYSYEHDTYYPGIMGVNGSWLYHSAGVAGGRVAIGDPAAPLKEGKIELTRNEDGTYNLSVDVVDDLTVYLENAVNHKIKLTANNLTFDDITDVTIQ